MPGPGPIVGSSPEQEDDMADPVQFNLSPDDLPTAWFNILPDMVQAGMQPLPPLHPGTKEPVTPNLIAPLFPESLIMQDEPRGGRSDADVNDRDREAHPAAGRRVTGLARDRHQRGHGGGGDERGHELLARLGPEPRAAAPDGDRARGQEADGDDRRAAGR